MLVFSLMRQHLMLTPTWPFKLSVATTITPPEEETIITTLVVVVVILVVVVIQPVEEALLSKLTTLVVITTTTTVLFAKSVVASVTLLSVATIVSTTPTRAKTSLMPCQLFQSPIQVAGNGLLTRVLLLT